MPYPVVLGAMLCDAPGDGLRCCMMPYNATWCFAMPHDVPQYSAWGAAIRCDACIVLPYAATLCCPMPLHCAVLSQHIALPHATHCAAPCRYTVMPDAATLCCPMPPHCAALCCHTALPYATTLRCPMPPHCAVPCHTLCCPMPTCCAALCHHTVLLHADTLCCPMPHAVLPHATLCCPLHYPYHIRGLLPHAGLFPFRSLCHAGLCPML